jgi:hypothetical protein
MMIDAVHFVFMVHCMVSYEKHLVIVSVKKENHIQ